MTRQRKINVAPDAQPVAKPEPPGNQAQDKRAEAEKEFLDIQRVACDLSFKEFQHSLESIQTKFKTRMHIYRVEKDGQFLRYEIAFEPAPLNQ
jgi:hypothetical protein